VNPCQGGTNANAVRSVVCSDGNPEPIILGAPVATNGGEIASAFKKFRDCWASKTGKNKPWNLTLLVIDCPGNNVGTCETVVGAVTVNIVPRTALECYFEYGTSPGSYAIQTPARHDLGRFDADP
jgi:hypothetical protein